MGQYPEGSVHIIARNITTRWTVWNVDIMLPERTEYDGYGYGSRIYVKGMPTYSDNPYWAADCSNGVLLDSLRNGSSTACVNLKNTYPQPEMLTYEEKADGLVGINPGTPNGSETVFSQRLKDKKRARTRKIVGIVVGCVAGVGLLVAIFLCVRCVRRRKKRKVAAAAAQQNGQPGVFPHGQQMVQQHPPGPQPLFYLGPNQPVYQQPPAGAAPQYWMLQPNQAQMQHQMQPQMQSQAAVPDSQVQLHQPPPPPPPGQAVVPGSQVPLQQPPPPPPPGQTGPQV